MKKVNHKNLIVFLLAIILLMSFCSCSIFDFNKNASQDMEYDFHRDYITYTYKNKAQVSHSRVVGRYYDTLALLIGDDFNNSDDCFSALFGEFESIGWNEGELFVNFDGKYYVLNVDEYQVPDYYIDKEDGEKPEYSLIEYTPTEFIEKYPNFETFEWVTFGSPAYNAERERELGEEYWK